MCMGGGSSGPPARIEMPDTRAYDRQFELQKAAMEQQMQGQAQLMQMQLNQSLQSKQELMQQLRDIKVERANNVERLDAKARQMSVLMGAPPPEKSATPPLVGNQRESNPRQRGKSNLRIDRPVASSSSQGTGLNIS